MVKIKYTTPRVPVVQPLMHHDVIVLSSSDEDEEEVPIVPTVLL